MSFSRAMSHAEAQMRFGFITSFLMAILAIVSVFIDIPIVSLYAFWFVVGAYVVLTGAGSW
jgi:hypothetical protein